MKNKDLYIKRLVAQGMSEEEAERFVNLIAMDATTTNESFYIKVDYQTGDSFGTEWASCDINLPWHNISIVNENIERLEEQLTLYKTIDSTYSFSKEEIEKAHNDWANARWAVTKDNFDDKPFEHFMYTKAPNGKIYNNTSIKLLKDDGTEFEISVMSWEGYFENFQSFSIEKVDKHEMN